jgi:hypothetical protein
LIVSGTSQKRALQNYRRRLARRGQARFEVVGLDADRELISTLVKRLTKNDVEAIRIRAKVRRKVAGRAQKKGGILLALRRSPLVGANLNLGRSTQTRRKVDE